MIRALRCHSCRELVLDPRAQPSGAASTPAPGDFWLCRHCGELHRFGPLRLCNGVPVITLRPAELAELEALEPDQRAHLLAARDQLRRPN